jgi:transcriptional regulator with XRE-family HTH domain
VTALSRYFYDAYRASGLTYETVARRSKISRSTVWAYIQGTRGGAGQPRSARAIRAIAEALDLDPDHAVDLAGSRDPSGLAAAIRDDKTLSKREREALLTVLDSFREK